MLRILVCIALWAASVSPAIAQHSHVALVIGNGDYQEVADLPNAARDAQAMALMLQRLGYQTTLITNADRRRMIMALAQLRVASQNASQVVVFFSGHGAQVQGQGMLLGRNVPAEAADLNAFAVSVDVVLRAVSDKPRQKIVLLDACRTPVLYNQAMLSAPTAAIQAGSYIAFASQPGSPAFDGRGALSPFTEALLYEMSVKPLPISDLFQKVRRRVVATTSGQQVPWSLDVLLQDAVLSGRLNGL